MIIPVTCTNREAYGVAFRSRAVVCSDHIWRTALSPPHLNRHARLV
jgi:hypothetical protein